MAYCSTTDLQERYTSTKISAWSGNSDEPSLVKAHCVSIAVYRLLVRKELMGEVDPGEQGTKEDYDDAIKYLEKVAMGKLRIPSVAENSGGKSAIDIRVKTHSKLDLGGFV